MSRPTRLPLERAAILDLARSCADTSPELRAFVAERCAKEPLGYGSARATHEVRGTGLVLKTPFDGSDSSGVVANLCEAAVWQHRWRMPRARYKGPCSLPVGWQHRIAPTRLVWFGDVPCVFQWALSDPCRGEDLGWEIVSKLPKGDHSQCGADRHGVRRVYDFEFLFPYSVGRGRGGWMREALL